MLLLVSPLFIMIVRYSLATFSARRARKRQPQQDDDGHLLPPSPPALPVLGHLHLMGSLPHVSLHRLARKHGSDLMLLRLGAMPVLVVSSPRAAEAVLRTHDLVCASRPHSLVTEIVMYGPSDVGFVPYGDYWRRVRKLVTTHLLTVKRVQALRLAREEEVSAVMARISEAAAAGAAVDVGELLGSFANDLACRAVMGKSFRGEGRNKLFRELVSDTSPLLAGFNVEEFFPFLSRFGVLSRMVRAKSERLRRRWDEQLDRLIEDHESSGAAAAASTSSKDDDDDFIDVLLSVRQEYGLTREHMKAMLLDVFFGGIGTGASVLEFTVAELMLNHDVMKNLQAEIRSVVPKGQVAVSEDNLRGMVYLRAVIKESLRLHPPTTLLTAHFTMASFSVDGFTVPAGVRVLVNAWAIATDARFWENPEAFVPERFLDGGSAEGVGFRGTDFQFLPFGSGRRMCPGMNFGVASVELMLANLVHGFDWELPPGKVARDIDMSEVFGLVVHRKEKLLLLPRRL
ncbi:indole-2-monooxygenase [Dichanthelium oligosanthes]|uniref:Indole-2-monooxygenase n=1 Tax=Dichanthelium oligosanthes TaxID=888268 RepID=A0A1E5WAH3_9POAL|nr:indole-2-monooxygenase [Dichanthelium oligosanthes]